MTRQRLSLPSPLSEVFGPDRYHGLITTEELTKRQLDEPRLIERLWRECRIRIADRPRTDQLPMLD